MSHPQYSDSDRTDQNEQPRGLLRGMLVRTGEGLAALAIVIAFFMVFLLIIAFSFPQGSSLRDLMLQPQLASERHETSGIEFNLAPDRTKAVSFAARLSSIRRTVKNKRAGAIAWHTAQSGMFLEDRHSIQTYSRSGAEIAFGDGNQIDLGENSLIVVRRLEETHDKGRRRASLMLLDGLLDGEASTAINTDMALELIAPDGSALLLSEGTSKSDFRIAVNPDRSSTYTMYEGQAEVRSGGKTITLEPYHAVTVSEFKPPGVPRSLPTAPSLVSPGHGQSVVYRTTPPRVRFAWEAQPESVGYRIEISRDREFKMLLHQQRVDSPEFVHGNLGEGRYYWRVTTLDGWIEGIPTAAQELNLTRDMDPPALQVAFPDGPLHQDRAVVQGNAEPGAEVFFGDTEIRTAPSGAFAHEVRLDRGVNVLVVEAVDSAGNITYRSKLVHARF